MSSLSTFLNDKRIIVCCGAGGVGKTTVSAALALAAARRGRRVLVLTIDPSRRLAETLGISRNLPDPLPLAPDKQQAGGINHPGELHAWVLDPGLVADKVVRSLVPTRDEARSLLGNRIYQAVTRMVAGMQEYTAVEALHRLTLTGKYDLIILDTPPSRNALSFLDAPIRLGRFLDGRIFKLFLPREDGFLRGAARMVTWKVLATVLGPETHVELTSFLTSFRTIFRVLGGSANQMKARLQGSDTNFLLITSSAQAAVQDALHFRSRLDGLQLPCGGFVLNRSMMSDDSTLFPDESLLPGEPSPVQVSALAKLQTLAAQEREVIAQEAVVLQALADEASGATAAAALPEIPGGVEDMESLAKLVDWMEANDFGRYQPPAA